MLRDETLVGLNISILGFRESKETLLLHVPSWVAYPASRAFLSGTSFSMYIVVLVSGIPCQVAGLFMSQTRERQCTC